ncbi:SDR family NAD(P)-dependent oxidoreductase [Pseudomonadota bacterium]
MHLPKNPLDLFNVNDKVAVITGCTGSLGSMASQLFGRSGCKLILSDRKDAPFDDLTRQLDGEDIDYQIVRHLPDTESHSETIVETGIDSYGRVDILLVASGYNDTDAIENFDQERWQKVMDANVTGPWLICKAMAKRLIPQKQGGKVILISSTRSILGHPAGYSGYCTSKSAVDGLVRSLACEWGQYGININALGPTVFRSNLSGWMFEDNEHAKSVRDGMLARVPLGRLGEPEDLAGTLLFLASSASDFCTGQIIRPDGGYTAG